MKGKRTKERIIFKKKKKKKSDYIRQRLLEIVVFIFGILYVHVCVCIGFNRIGIIFETLVLIE